MMDFDDESNLSELDSDFQQAVDQVGRNSSNMDQTSLLYLYGRYKVATEGACSIPKPGLFDIRGRRKWEAWKELDAMNSETAKSQYVNFVRETLKLSSESTAQKSAGGGFGQSISKFAMEDEVGETQDIQLDANVVAWFDAVKANDLAACKSKLKSNDSLSRAVDGQRLNALHWVADRNSLDVAKWLLDQVAVDKETVNAMDVDGQTPLHYAASCDNFDVASTLIAHGADKSVKNADGETPLDLASSEEIRQLLKK